MASYVISYDLNSPGQKHTKLLAKIKSYGSWARLSESCYAISTFKSPDGIFSDLAGLIDRNDQLYVIGLHRPWNGFGPNDVNTWLDTELDSC